MLNINDLWLMFLDDVGEEVEQDPKVDDMFAQWIEKQEGNTIDTRDGEKWTEL